MLGRVDVGGSRDKSSGGASGGRGGKGEEFKDQHVGEGRRIDEDDDRYGWIGVDSSAERAGPEDCGTSGVSFSENVGVGGHEHHLCSLSLKSCRQEGISSHMENLKDIIEDRRNQVQSWNADICHIDRCHSCVHDSRVYVDRVLIEIASLGIRTFDLKSPKNNTNIRNTTTIKR